MLLNAKIFWLAGLVLLAALPFIGLKLLSLTAKKPERVDNPSTLAPCPDSPNCVCSEEPRDSHSVAPLKFTADAEQAWSRLRSVLQELGGEEIRAGETYLWFEFRTPLIGFTDDVECRLNTAQQQIEIRSASRVGHSDLGANRKRVEAIRAAFGAGGQAALAQARGIYGNQTSRNDLRPVHLRCGGVTDAQLQWFGFGLL